MHGNKMVVCSHCGTENEEDDRRAMSQQSSCGISTLNYSLKIRHAGCPKKVSHVLFGITR